MLIFKLRKLVDRGLFTGPMHHQPIRTCPFAIIEAGQELMDRIERGLHHPRWLNQVRADVLRTLEGRGPTPRIYVVRVTKLAALRANYLAQEEGGIAHLTDRGHEALAEVGE